MTETSELDRRIERWHRVEPRMMSALPYALLLVSCVVTVALPPEDAAARVALIVGVPLTVVWITWFATLHPQWVHRPVLNTTYVVGLAVLTAALVIAQPWFAFFAFLGYLNAGDRLRGVAAGGVLVCTAATIALAQTGGVSALRTHAWVFAILFVVNATLAAVFGHFFGLTERQNEQRRTTIDALAETNARLESALSGNVGLHAQLLVQARAAGVNDERQRLAREIHDTIAQGLAGIVTQLEAAGEGSSADAARHLDLARGLARESLGEARRSVQALQPEQLDGVRLPDALRLLSKRWAETSGVSVQVETTGEPVATTPDVDVALYRVTQESLANVARHANASRAAVTLSYLGDTVALDILDDGHGFLVPEWGQADPSPSVDGTRFGLRAMQQRVDRVDGHLLIESAPTGTTVSAVVPLSSRDIDSTASGGARG